MIRQKTKTMRDLSLHILDIAENSAAADATAVSIGISINLTTDRLALWVSDNGRGMDPDTVRQVTDPFYTSRTTRKVGLGIPLLKEAAESCDGELSIESTPGKGTRLDAWFKNSHIDRMPLGDVTELFVCLLVGESNIHWIFEYTITPANGGSPVSFIFDDQQLKQIMGQIHLSHPDVLAYLRPMISQGIEDVNQKTGYNVMSTPIKSLEDLKRIRDEALQKRDIKSSDSRVQIVVGMGTTGIAAGARDTIRAILEFIETEKLFDVSVRQTGSMGKDSYEPIVQVTIVDEPTVLYGRVNADVARRIMSQHVLGGKIVAENVIPS